YLMRRASDSVIRTFIDKAPTIGIERRQEDRDEVDESEVRLLSVALSRSLPASNSIESLKIIRDSFPKTGSPRTAIWFAAAAQTAGIAYPSLKEMDLSSILSELIEKAKGEEIPKGRSEEITPASATALLFILTNPTFLQISGMRPLVER